jgi:hypothetical protein
MLQFGQLDLGSITVLLCDADGNLFPSEEPAFVASAEVTNRFMASLGLSRRFYPEELRLATTGKNFRTTAVDLAVGGGVPVEATLAVRYPGAVTTTTDLSGGTPHMLTAARLEHWVQEEKQAVTAHAGKRLGITPWQGLAIEDSVPGAQSAVAAGLQTIGNVAFVPPAERAGRVEALRQVGVAAVILSWGELKGLLG